MNVAEWILVSFLSVALLIFLIVAIILIVKLIKLTDEAKKIVEKGQDIADNANDIVNNVRSYTTFSGVAGALGSLYNTIKDNKKRKDENGKEKE